MAQERLAGVVSLFDEFKKAFNQQPCDLDKSQQYLARLKICMTEFTCMPPDGESEPQLMKQELLLAREILEHGALLSIRTKDIPAFERHVAQLKIFYNDFSSVLPDSQRQYHFLGLNLLRLLAQNRIAEFHTELELIPAEMHHSNIYIKYPTQLEQYIMEGSYNKVLNARADSLYSSEGMYFMDMLVDTVREEIADCSEKAYKTMSCQHAQSMLMLSTPQELVEYAENRGWTVENGDINFQQREDKQMELPATKLIHETLSYAKELERIV